MFNLPLYTINLSCCKMPPENDIADVWRENILGILKFINMGRTGAKGYVKDKNGNPLRNARIKVKGGEREYRVTKNLGFFHVVVPQGSSQLEVICENFTTRTINVNYGEQIVDLKDIILEPDTSGKVQKHYSVSGFVVDDKGTPIIDAEIGVKGNWRKQAYTNKFGEFEMSDINEDNPILTVKAHGYKKSEKLVAMNLVGTTKNVIFKLVESQDDMGLTNLLFIFFICITILFSVVCVTCCAINGCNFKCGCCGKETRGRLMDNYKFSLLTRKKQKNELFADDVYGDDSEEEEELFNPMKSRGT